MISYIGSESDCPHGLAIALEDASNSCMMWKDAPSAVAKWSSSYAIKETTWRVPTVNDLKCMNQKGNQFFTMINESGGQKVQPAFYWTATENEAGIACYYLFNNSVFQYGNKTHDFYVRAVLAF